MSNPNGDMRIILDIGGEGNIRNRTGLAAKPSHPVWGKSVWFSLNIEASKNPDILADAVNLASVLDSRVDGIYSSHTIEHIDPNSSQVMLRNWLRVLKPSGRVEIRCPDAEWTWTEYLAGRLPDAIVTELVLGIRTGQYEVHRNLWWAHKLIGELEAAGFVHARRIDYGFCQSGIDFWLYDGKHPEHHGFRVIDLLVEAYKAPVPSVNSVAPLNVGPTKRHVMMFERAFRRALPSGLKEPLRRIRLRRQHEQACALLSTILADSDQQG